MSYTVIARRWRPRKFEDVVGQAHIVTTLKNSIKRERIAHAYLFSGPRGVGKTSISRILAKAVNCLEGVKEEPCNACRNCVGIDSGAFVDVIEIDAASNRGIDEIRELRETVRYLPMEGRYKVYIIDEAHMLTEPAFNALLKTLEEPPGHNIFILATTESQKIPYTIMSRCQRFDFRRISEAQIIEQLKRVLEFEKIGCDEPVLNYVVREADGSMRDAESILDQVIAFSGSHISEQNVIDVIGVVERDVAYAIVQCVIERNARGGLELIANTLERGHDSYQVYKGLLSFLRDMLMIKVWEGKPPFLFMGTEEFERINSLASHIEYYEIQNMVNFMLHAEDVVRGLFPKIALEVLFINLYNLSQLKEVEDLIDSLPPQQQRKERPLPPVSPPFRETEPVKAAPVVETAEPPAPPKTTPKAEAFEDIPLPDSPMDEEDYEPEPEPSQLIQPSNVVKGPHDFTAHLKAKSKMLYAMFGSHPMHEEDGVLNVPLDKKLSTIKHDTAIIDELKRHASDFFQKDVVVQFVDDKKGKADTIDDYVKEAARLFDI